MKPVLVSVLVAVLAVSAVSPAFAQSSAASFRDPGTIQRAIAVTPAHEARAGRRPLLREASPAQAEASTPSTDPWPKRHAVLLGTLAGFAVGFPIGVATCKYPTAEGSSCRDYTYPGNARLLGGFTIGGLGAAIGAGVGAIVKAAR